MCHIVAMVTGFPKKKKMLYIHDVSFISVVNFILV